MMFTEDAYKKAQKVKLVIFDVDGVMTDGGIYVGENGELYKPFFCRDGLAITLLRKNGFKTAIITGRQSRQLTYRATELKIDKVFQGHQNKRSAYKELKAELQLSDEEIAYIGDDLIDIPVMVQTGFPAAVGDAVAEVKEIAAFTANAPGGRGAIREIAEFILKAQGKWDKIIAEFKEPADIDGLAQ